MNFEYDLIDMTHSYLKKIIQDLKEHNVTKNEITEYLWYMETLY